MFKTEEVAMMRKSTVVLSAALFAGSAAAQNSTATVGTLRADTAQVGVIAPRPAQEEGLLLYLPFEADEGGSVTDAGGNGHGGAALNCAWTNGGRFAGGAMSFNGSDSSVGFPTVPDFPSWGAYSVSAWFLHDGGGCADPQYGHKIIDKTSWDHEFYISLYPPPNSLGLPGFVSFVAYEGGSKISIYDASYNYADTNWHHVAVVRDQSAVQLWIDGVLKDSTNNMLSVYSESALCVGNSFSGDSYQRTSWSGLIDEVRVYGRALTGTEIGKLYAEGLLVLLPPPPTAVTVAGDLGVAGVLSAAGPAAFNGGVRHCLPLGDLSSGIYTNAP